MNVITVSIGSERFQAAFRADLAPATCSLVQTLLPWRQKLIHARWSGEACWVPLGDARFDLGYENATSCSLPGEFLFYPGGKSEAEILLPYGPTIFRSKAGQLAGNPFLTILDRLDRLQSIGREILWNGAQTIEFTREP